MLLVGLLTFRLGVQLVSVVECRERDTAEEALAEAEVPEEPVENITLAGPSHADYGAEGEEATDAAPVSSIVQIVTKPFMNADVQFQQSDQQQLELGCSSLLLATEQEHR